MQTDIFEILQKMSSITRAMLRKVLNIFYVVVFIYLFRPIYYVVLVAANKDVYIIGHSPMADT